MRISHLLLCVGVAAVFFACDRNVTHVEEVAGPGGCNDCHNSSDVITAKHTEWAESRHGTGTAFEEGTNKNCAFCHSGSAFSTAVAAGLKPNQLPAGDDDPTRQDCRACHQIHETYTAQDWALETTAPVSLYAIAAGATFDGGAGNLCVNCHQPRRDAPVANASGIVTGISEHWGPHHGPQSAMILGLAGAGVAGTPHQHYGVQGTCVQCHMGIKKGVGGNDIDGNLIHTFEPEVANCNLKACHPGATNFDINGRQSEIIALADQLGELLLADSLITENSPDGHPTVTSAPEDQAFALWNWLYVAHEDKSNGAHNYPYAKALLEEGIARMTPAATVSATR